MIERPTKEGDPRKTDKKETKKVTRFESMENQFVLVERKKKEEGDHNKA